MLQVQDAGLIFLSQIASQIADQLEGEPTAHIVATTLVALSVSTAALGIALILTGYLRLAMLVQVPPPPRAGERSGPGAASHHASHTLTESSSALVATSRHASQLDCEPMPRIRPPPPPLLL